MGYLSDPAIFPPLSHYNPQYFALESQTQWAAIFLLFSGC